MKSRVRASRTGFTLIEMIVVMAIILVLTGLTIGGMAFVHQKQARAKAAVQVKLLASGLDAYNSENGLFPSNSDPDGKNGTKEIYDKLFREPLAASTSVYLEELNPEQSGQGWVEGTIETVDKIIDPWGNEYRYRTGDDAVNPDFDLWSAGPDGKTNPGTNGNYDPDDPDNVDDIREW